MTSRREFLKQTAIACGAVVAGSGCQRLANHLATTQPETPEKKSAVRNLKHPVAIAMWDFSWLLRRHPNGGFEDWDLALDELAERGYNAVRIDVFPHLVALAGSKEIPERVTFKGDPSGYRLWGNDVDVTVNPREALLEFIPKCRKRGIYVDASTWFCDPSNIVEKVPEVKEFEGFVKVWSETLDFMDSNGLLNNILFIDLLNEYPYWNGFNWLKQEAKAAANKTADKSGKVGEAHIQDGRDPGLSDAERAFYKQFSTDVLKYFRTQRPQYDFTLSITAAWDNFHPDLNCDMSSMDVYDMHMWFSQCPGITNFELPKAARSMTPAELEAYYAILKKTWKEKREGLINWTDQRFGMYAKAARQHNAILGNTEGWGAVCWDDVEPLDWNFIKEAGEISVELAIKHNYRFICTSNFTHPHFKRLWADTAWHKSLTQRIRNA